MLTDTGDWLDLGPKKWGCVKEEFKSIFSLLVKMDNQDLFKTKDVSQFIFSL